jgi:hypothetical protein
MNMPSDPIANVANYTLYMEVSTSPVQVCEQQEVLASERAMGDIF